MFRRFATFLICASAIPGCSSGTQQEVVFSTVTSSVGERESLIAAMATILMDRGMTVSTTKQRRNGIWYEGAVASEKVLVDVRLTPNRNSCALTVCLTHSNKSIATRKFADALFVEMSAAADRARARKTQAAHEN